MEKIEISIFPDEITVKEGKLNWPCVIFVQDASGVAVRLNLSMQVALELGREMHVQGYTGCRFELQEG